MYCSKCGVQNSDGSTHCINCGSILMDVTAAPAAGQVQPPAEQAPPKTCGLAVAAFVMGLLSMTCVLWPLLALPALICGIVALVKISKSNGQLKGTGMAVTGLVIPAVLTFILPLFFAIMMPALSKAKQTAITVVCSTNMRGLSTAIMVYMNDYDDEFPTPEQWCDLLIEKADMSPKSFQCPEDPEGSFSYAVNSNIYEAEPGVDDAQMVVLFEADLGKNAVGGINDVVFRHQQGVQRACNIAFADGHVEFVTEDRIPDLQWTAE